MILSVEAMIRQYVEAWNKDSQQAFRTAFASCWATEATYTDPDFALVKGVDGIAELAYISLQRTPVRRFHVLTVPEYHHHVGRYTWRVDLPEGTKQGLDYFEFNDEFKITRLVSFF